MGMDEVLENKSLLIFMKHQGLKLELCVYQISILLPNCTPTLFLSFPFSFGKDCLPTLPRLAINPLYPRQGLSLRGSYLSTLSNWAFRSVILGPAWVFQVVF